MTYITEQRRFALNIDHNIKNMILTTHTLNIFYNVTIDFTDYMPDTKQARIGKGRTYSWAAILTDFVSSKKFERAFFNATDLYQNEGWSVKVGASFLEDLKRVDVIELELKIMQLIRYSSVTNGYFLVEYSDEHEVIVSSWSTRLKAFQHVKNFAKVVESPVY